MRSVLVGLMAIAAFSSMSTAWAEPQSLAPYLKTLREVEREGKGNLAAAQAWAKLTSRARVDELPTILEALDGAGPLAANWLRSAVDAIAERHIQAGEKLPVAQLEVFLGQQQHDPRARRVVYELIVQSDPTAADRLVPKMLDDSSLELRRDAVARVIATADAAVRRQENDLAIKSYAIALSSARDLDQVKTVSEALTKLGHPVDLAEHFGLLLDWKIVGPFDNHQGKGFDVAYPPEAAVDLAAAYPVQSGTIRWISHHTEDGQGAVDLNKALGKQMGAVAYVAAEFQSDVARPAELRLGSENANKIWLNGTLLAAAEAYHANGTMDQYVGRGELKAGRNLILVKICQNEQTEEWAQDWKFQFRVCDATGGAILSTDRPAPRKRQNQTAANKSPE